MIVVWKPKSRSMLSQRCVNALFNFGKFLGEWTDMFSVLDMAGDYDTHLLKCCIALSLSSSVAKVMVEA